MNFYHDRYTLRLATSEDNDGIREIFEHGTFDGGISVQYLRNPHPYESFSADGESNYIMVIVDHKNQERIAAIGGAVTRKEYVNGTIETCAYLTGLKIHPDYQRKISFIADAYEFMHQNISDCTYCYTTILDDNTKVITMLEKKRPNMPTYHYVGHYTTYCFHGGKPILTLEKNHMDGFETLMKTYFATQSLTPIKLYAGLGSTQFYCVRKNSEIITCCFVGNQQMFKQYKMCAYHGIYKLISKLPTKVLGYPAFPPSDHLINHGVIAYLYVKDNDQRLCSDFLRSVAAETNFSLLLWGGMDTNPLCQAMNHMKTIHYGSRLYLVEWDKEARIQGEIGMEVGLL